MKKLSKDKREKLILIIVGTVLVVGVGYYGLIRSQQGKRAKSLATLQDEQSKVDNAKRLISSVDALKVQLANASAVLEDLESGMATGDMYSWIILKVNQFKKDYNVKIPQFSREVTGEVSILPRFPYRAATFTVKGTAHFHEFGKFLAAFENEFPYVRVQNLHLSPADAKSASGEEMASEELSFRMELVTLINPMN